MKRKESHLHHKLRRTEESREDQLHKVLSERGPLRRGSFVTLSRKCGKPTCHCATGKGHPAKYLSIKEGGRTRMVFIPSHLEEIVADEVERYRRFRQSRATLAKLARESLEIIDKLERELQTEKKIEGKSRKKSGRKARSSKKKD